MRHSSILTLALLVSASSASGCSLATSLDGWIFEDQPDGGHMDAGPRQDAGPGGGDAGPTDGGGQDDAGPSDAGLADGGSPDAGGLCGDMLVDTEAGEVCDDGNTVGGDGCSADCRSNEECGNGIRDLATGEACDDGNTLDGDGCPGDCALEPVAVTAGWTHTCALLSDGRVFCWGSNESGELGVSSSVTPSSSTPLEVPGITDAVQITSGHDHNCAVTAAEEVLCWGANDFGQLGRGTIEASPVPVAVPGVVAPIQVAAGRSHTCALETDGRVMCWGRNNHGQLGNGASLPAPVMTTPVRVSGLTGAVELGANFQGMCARLSTGEVRCWGYNANGQLAQGTDLDVGAGDPSSVPVAVMGLEGSAVSLSKGSGGHFCASVGAGSVNCWGFNQTGQLGDGTTTHRSLPIAVAGLTAVEFGTGGHTCAISADAISDVRCWGRNTWGQLGDGTVDQATAPVTVSGLMNASRIAVGERHSCALQKGGLVFCWGNNDFGQLGDLTNNDRPAPVAVSVEW